MSGKIPALPPAAAEPVKTYLKPPPAQAAATPARPAEHHVTPALSAADVGYVDSLMGFAPAQTMEYIMLKTGIPMPENLGVDIDTSV